MSASKQLKFEFVLDSQSFQQVKRALGELTTEAQKFAKAMQGSGGGLFGGANVGSRNPSQAPTNGKMHAAGNPMGPIGSTLAQAVLKDVNAVRALSKSGADAMKVMKDATNQSLREQIAIVENLDKKIASLQSRYASLKGPEMFNFIKNIFSSKHERDVKAYSSVVDAVNKNFAHYASLDNDQLRNITIEFRNRIKEYLAPITADIQNMEKNAAEMANFHEKENLYNEIDKLRKDKNKSLEAILMEILPEAFPVVKETARRFKENATLTVTATEHDRNIAASKDYVMIDGDKAMGKNEWTAAGGEAKWDMLHYDVQLIGGMVLHEGKIAEMATGR